MSQRKIKLLRQQVGSGGQPLKDRRLRIMWNSNAPWSNSGYAVEMRDLLYRLIKDGWPVAEIAFSGLEGSPLGLNGLTVYPKMADTWGSDAMYYHAKHWGANVVFSMQDVWPLNPQFLQMLMNDKIPWIPWVPIDQTPAPMGVISNLRLANRIITFSKFGKLELQKKGFASKLILEGTDCNIFQPRDKKEARMKLGWQQDKFIFGMIGANKENPPRKGWQEALEAFKKFTDVHPDALLYIHSNQWFPTGFPIMEYANYLGIRDKVFQIDQYTVTFHSNSQSIALIMNALDCLLEPSMTEGFGLPIIEAQASGVPVIINECTSMPELIKEGITSEMCKVKHRMFSNQQGFINFADSNSLYEKMELVFKNTPDFYKDAARQWILDNFDIDKLVQNEWIPYLEELQKELLPPLTPKLQSATMTSTRQEG